MVHVSIEVRVERLAIWRNIGHARSLIERRIDRRLSLGLILGSAIVAGRSSLLFESFLFWRVGKADLHDMILATTFGNGLVVEFLDYGFTGFATVKAVISVSALSGILDEVDLGGGGPSKTNTTAGAIRGTENSARANFERFKNGRELLISVSPLQANLEGGWTTHMFIHVLGQVGHIQIGVIFSAELLELTVKRFLELMSKTVIADNGATHSSKACFVTAIVEPADAVLGIPEIVILDKAIPGEKRQSHHHQNRETADSYPLQQPVA